MANQSDQFRFIKSQRSLQDQNYFIGNLLCIQNDLSIESTKKRQASNKLIEENIIQKIAVENYILDKFDQTIQKTQEADKQQLIEKDKTNEVLKYYNDQIQEYIIDQSNCYQEIKQKEESKFQKENYYENQSNIQQIVVESNTSDKFNQMQVQFYQEDSQSLTEKDKINFGQSNEINQNMEYEHNFTELMNQIQFNLKQYNYHLTQLMHFYEYEDIYLGYQNKDDTEKQTLIFKIFYNQSQQNRVIYRQKTQIENKNLDQKVSKLINFRCQEHLCSYQDIDKLIKIIEYEEMVFLKCDRIISVSNNANILVMKQDNYNQIMQKYSYQQIKLLIEQVSKCQANIKKSNNSVQPL
ncbi:hypothetical protein ABPG73_007836 [Tetrahymena malaccensis]